MNYQERQLKLLSHASQTIGIANYMRCHAEPEGALVLLKSALPLLIRVHHGRLYGGGHGFMRAPSMLHRLYDGKHIELGTYQSVRDAVMSTSEYGDGRDIRQAIETAKTYYKLVRDVPEDNAFRKAVAEEREANAGNPQYDYLTSSVELVM